MGMAIRARKAETPKQPSHCLRLRALHFYPDRLAQRPLGFASKAACYSLRCSHSTLGTCVPRIPDRLQRAIVYLYPTAEAARTGTGAGGTGFVVALRGEHRADPFLYLITNIHVANGGNRTLRVNTTDGGVEILEIPSAKWVNHPEGDDIAACLLTPPATWAISALEWSDLAVTSPRMAELNMGVGDEVFMLGRFVSHEGVQLNQPLARFGNIAMMPGQPVKDGRELLVEAFLVEMRSLSGFSGSPVFVYMGPGTYRGNGTMMPIYSATIGLMGIDTGHKITTERPRNRGDGSLTDLEVPMSTGISIVSPVWKIRNVLDEEILASERTAPHRG
jgi:hypothetical protein